MQKKYRKAVSAVLMVVLLAITIYSHSFYLIFCSGYQVFVFAIRKMIIIISCNDTKVQQIKYKKIAWLPLLPSIVLTIASIGLYFIEDSVLVKLYSYIISGIAGAMVITVLHDIIGLWKDKNLSARFIKWIDVLSICTLFAMIVRAMLLTHSPKEADELSAMSGGIFGLFAILISINLILVSLCGYKSTRESIQMIFITTKSKKWAFARMALLKDTFLVIGKTAISIATFSFFMFVNALYSVGLGTARLIALRMKGKNKKEQLQCFRLVGIVIFLTSLCYALYSVRLFMGQKTLEFPMIIALSIAVYTFLEFGINIRDAIRLRMLHDLESAALKFISLASTMICFVLTQTAILSFADERDTSAANGLAGILFGGIAGLIGLFMIVKSYRLERESQEECEDFT